MLASPPFPSVSRLYFISPLPLNVQRPQISNQLHACNYMLCRDVAATPPAWRVRALRCPLNKRVRWRMAPPPLNSHPYPPSWGVAASSETTSTVTPYQHLPVAWRPRVGNLVLLVRLSYSPARCSKSSIMDVIVSHSTTSAYRLRRPGSPVHVSSSCSVDLCGAPCCPRSK